MGGDAPAVAPRVLELAEAVAVELVLDRPRLGRAELEIGTGMVMLADEFPDHGFLSPLTIGGTPVTVHVYVEDADALAEEKKLLQARRAIEKAIVALGGSTEYD